MCFTVTLKSGLKKTEKRFNAKFEEPGNINPIFYENAFSLPKHPTILNEDPSKIQLVTWGLIPHWVKENEAAEKIRMKTFNARAETILEKPVFRDPAKNKHCLVIVDGFFEWQEVKGKKYPYYIHLKNEDPFAIAGIWDEWADPKTGEILKTFSIITCEAIGLVKKIHNTKLRQPCILSEENEQSWLSEKLSKEDIKDLTKPFEPKELNAYTVSKLVTKRGVNRNVPEVVKKHNYPELD